MSAYITLCLIYLSTLPISLVCFYLVVRPENYYKSHGSPRELSLIGFIRVTIAFCMLQLMFQEQLIGLLFNNRVLVAISLLSGLIVILCNMYKRRFLNAALYSTACESVGFLVALNIINV